MLRNSAVAQAVTALDETMRREAKRHLFWSRFMGNIQKAENYNNDMDLRPSGAPIEVNDMINTPGLGDRMLIPMVLELAGLGRLGDAVMLGHEEDFARKYAMIHYNQIRHGVPVQKGLKDYSNEAILKMMQYAQPMLSWWHAQRENWEIIHAIYLGAGEALTTSTTDATYGQGLGIGKKIHPNLFSYHGATKALNAVTDTTGVCATMQDLYEVFHTDTSTNGGTMESKTLRLARQKMYSDLYMKPMFVHNGQKYWGIVIDPIQADTLKADALFTSNGSAAPLSYGLENHPMINGTIGIYGNFVVFEDPVAVRGYRVLTSGGIYGDPSTSGDVDITGSTTAVYDGTDKANPRFLPMTGMTKSNANNGSSNRGAIVIGGSMLGKAQHTPLSFKTEEFDYQNWKGISAGAMYGYERLDFIPEASTPTYSESVPTTVPKTYNRSSAVILTYQD